MVPAGGGRGGSSGLVGSQTELSQQEWDRMALTRGRRQLWTCWRVRGLAPSDLPSHPVVVGMGSREKVPAIKIEST